MAYKLGKGQTLEPYSSGPRLLVACSVLRASFGSRIISLTHPRLHLHLPSLPSSSSSLRPCLGSNGRIVRPPVHNLRFQRAKASERHPLISSGCAHHANRVVAERIDARRWGTALVLFSKDVDGCQAGLSMQHCYLTTPLALQYSCSGSTGVLPRRYLNREGVAP